MEDSLVELSTAGQNTASTALVGDFSTATVLSHLGARTALPMGVAPEIKLNCLQLRLNSILLQSNSPLPMGVTKGLDFVFGRSGLLHEFVQLLELTESLLHSNELFEFIQLLELTVSCCTRMNCSNSRSAHWLTCYACAVDVSANILWRTLCLMGRDSAVLLAALTGDSGCRFILTVGRENFAV